MRWQSKVSVLLRRLSKKSQKTCVAVEAVKAVMRRQQVKELRAAPACVLKAFSFFDQYPLRLSEIWAYQEDLDEVAKWECYTGNCHCGGHPDGCFALTGPRDCAGDGHHLCGQCARHESDGAMSEGADLDEIKAGAMSSGEGLPNYKEQ